MCVERNRETKYFSYVRMYINRERERNVHIIVVEWGRKRKKLYREGLEIFFAVIK